MQHLILLRYKNLLWIIAIHKNPCIIPLFFATVKPYQMFLSTPFVLFARICLDMIVLGKNTAYKVKIHQTYESV